MRNGQRNTLFPGFFLIFLLTFVGTANAQNLPIGGWRMHLPYQKCKSVTGSGSSVWAATDNGLFRLNKSDNALERITKIDGLSDLTIGTISYNAYNDILFVGYENGNIDLVHGKEIINLPDIKRAQIIGNKIINNVYFVGALAYVSTGFGIVVVDTDRKEVKDTYLIGPNGGYIAIYDIAIDATTIYAATASGIYYAPVNDPYLSNFVTWTKFNNIINNNSNSIFDALAIYHGKLIACRAVTYPILTYMQDLVYEYDISIGTWTTLSAVPSPNNIHDLVVQNDKLYLCDLFVTYEMDSTFSNAASNFYYPYNLVGSTTVCTPKQVFVDPAGTVWEAEPQFGLVKMTSHTSGESYFPNGPISTDAYFMAKSQGKILVVPGGHDDAWNNVGNVEGISTLKNGLWTNYNKLQIPILDTTYDFLAAAIDPLNANHYWLASWGKGLVEINNGSYVTTWNNYNSTLNSKVEYQWVGVSGLQYDTMGNLWVVNSHTTSALNVYKPDGTWQAFDFSALIPVGTTVAQLMITSTGQKWMILPRGGGMMVFDDNGTLSNTSDDKRRKLGFSAGVGNLPGTEVYSMAEDDDGEIWVGTDKGIAVFYCASDIFNSCDAQQILITQDTYVQILLETQTVTAIAVDGANRKWIGTESGGVFLMSPDGQTQVAHFDAANSPLLSDDITSITIDEASGEVFFGTSKGIVSYQGEANKGEDKMGDVYAYPNPVKHDYHGPIAITGLVKDADVKITDIRGEVVYKTTALGGRAIWDGNNFQGERAASGVYMVFISNADGSQKAVTKILLIN